MSKLGMGLVGVSLVADMTFGHSFNQVVFSEDFEAYAVDQPLPQKSGWVHVQHRPKSRCRAYIVKDKNNIFRTGRDNQVLQIQDMNLYGSIQLIAEVVPEPGTKQVRLSFDAYEPEGESTGSLGIKVGRGSVHIKKNESVNGIKLKHGHLRPGRKDDYSVGRKFHVDIYFNETSSSNQYAVADGTQYTLDSGSMDVWIDGKRKVESAVRERGVNSPTAITSLRIETFSSSMQEVWVDNIEVAIPQGSGIEKSGDSPGG